MKKVVAFLLLVATAGLFHWMAQEKRPEVVRPDVHYVPTPKEVVDDMLAMAKVRPGDILYDLGCGDGRIVITAARRWGIKGVGIEIDPKLVRESRRNAAKAKVADRVAFFEQDLFQTDFSDATVIALYLLPELNLRLRPKFFEELRPGSRVVSHSWDMGEWQADEARLSTPYWLEWFPDESTKRSQLFMWVIPANVSGIWKWREEDADAAWELRITQCFQQAQGVLIGPGGERPARVVIAGDRIRITARGPDDKGSLVFEGKAAGDHLEGTASFGSRPGSEIRPWKAARRPGTMKAIHQDKV
ncbi:MAG: class I SAM-dependent methyltransferase [Deltaproteobacteria bacterium]|nr:class I SAM-dependent methyltransferase [Deltaproteobacteria bacterium]